MLLMSAPVWCNDMEQNSRPWEERKEDLGIHLILNREEIGSPEMFPQPFNYMLLNRDVKFMKYGISLFERSIYRGLNAKDYDRMAELVAADAGKAVSKELIYQEGKLVYALLQMPSVDNVNRFIAFQNGKKDVTLVYMEGEATLDELKKVFAK